MVSIGNFRNQQLYLGANRNLSTAKTTLQVNTGAAKFRPSGKTTFIKIDNINSQPAQSKDTRDTRYDGLTKAEREEVDKNMKKLWEEFMKDCKDHLNDFQVEPPEEPSAPVVRHPGSRLQ